MCCSPTRRTAASSAKPCGRCPPPTRRPPPPAAAFACGYGDALPYIRVRTAKNWKRTTRAPAASGDTSTLRHARDEFDEVITRLENGERVPFLRLLLGKGTDPRPTGPAGPQAPGDLHDGRVQIPGPPGEPGTVDGQGPQRLRGDAVRAVPDAARQPERPDEHQPDDR